MPRLDVAPGPPPSIARDALGNALGGIRTPQVNVPIAALSGLGQSGGGFCGLFGTTTPFDAATLATRYPSHAKYVAAVVKAARKAVRTQVLLRADLPAIKAAALASDIGGRSAAAPACRRELCLTAPVAGHTVVMQLQR